MIFDFYYFCKSHFFERQEQKKVEKNFYHFDSFREKDQKLLSKYNEKSPYRVSKEFLIARSAKDLDIYGETPLSTIHTIVQKCGIKKNDLVIEMGAGRGRVSLFLSEFIGCQVYAYEQIPFFAENMIPSKNLKVFNKDMFTADFSKASFIYLYGTLLEDEEIVKLTKLFRADAKIITVSYPLRDYSSHYRVLQSFSGRFPWGKTKVYQNERIS